MDESLNGAVGAPKFPAPEPAEAADWYVAHLGFPNQAVFAEGGYAIVQRGDFVIHFWRCPDRKLAENTSCYCELPNLAALDAFYQDVFVRAARPGFHPGRLGHPPRDFSHGMREFFVWDPAGNLIQFGAETNSEKG